MKPSEYLSVIKTEVKTLVFWRDIVAEFISTFFLVSVQSALPLTWNKNFGGPVQTALGMGFIVCTMAWTLGDFGGGHMNPAVSFAMAICLKITVLRAVLYIVAQCIGGIAGAGFVYGMIPGDFREGLSATTLGEKVKPVQGVFIEAWITCILIITILGSTNSRRKGNVYMATIPIGFAVALGIMSGFGSTGGSMNPARSLGPAVVMGIWEHHWVYWIGPFFGSTVAVFIYFLCDCVDYKKDTDSKPAKISQEPSIDYVQGKENGSIQ